MDGLFLFSDDFKAILALLQNDEAIEEQFSATIGDVNAISVKSDLCLACIDRKELCYYTVHDIKQKTRHRQGN